jgi:23S rRNA (uracil1939-C5)-methyltransferase
MHLSPDAQRRAHEAHLRSALPREWQGAPIAVHEAAERAGFRARARLHVRASGGRAVVGLYESGTNDAIEVDRCIALDPALEQARLSLAALFEGTHGKGEVRLALGKPLPEMPALRRAVLDVRWDRALPAGFFGALFREMHGLAWAGASVVQGEASKPATVGDPTPWMLGADDVPLRLSPGGFAQASETVNRVLARRVAELAGGAAKIVELYAGAGNLTVMLAGSAEVAAVESERGACEAARANLAARGLRARVTEADATSYAVPRSCDLVVLDPPRSGARAVAERLVAAPPKRVLYVSCDTQTLARDLEILAPRYALRSADVFEMFPQTSHLESLVLLEKWRS